MIPDASALLLEIVSRLRSTEHSTAPLRVLRREYSRRIRDAKPKSVVRLAIELQASGVVHRFFGDELIANHKGAMASLTRTDIEKLGRGMDSWDKVDCFGTIVGGQPGGSGGSMTTWSRSGRVRRTGGGGERRLCARRGST